MRAKRAIRAGPRMKNSSRGSPMFRLDNSGQTWRALESSSGSLRTAIKGKTTPMVTVSKKAPRTIAQNKKAPSILSCGVRMYQSCRISFTCRSLSEPTPTPRLRGGWFRRQRRARRRAPPLTPSFPAAAPLARHEPDRNPFRQAQNVLRLAPKRTRDGLWRRIGALLDRFTSGDRRRLALTHAPRHRAKRSALETVTSSRARRFKANSSVGRRRFAPHEAAEGFPARLIAMPQRATLKAIVLTDTRKRSARWLRRRTRLKGSILSTSYPALSCSEAD